MPETWLNKHWTGSLFHIISQSNCPTKARPDEKFSPLRLPPSTTFQSGTNIANYRTCARTSPTPHQSRLKLLQKLGALDTTTTTTTTLVVGIPVCERSRLIGPLEQLGNCFIHSTIGFQLSSLPSNAVSLSLSLSLPRSRPRLQIFLLFNRLRPMSSWRAAADRCHQTNGDLPELDRMDIMYGLPEPNGTAIDT